MYMRRVTALASVVVGTVAVCALAYYGYVRWKGVELEEWQRRLGDLMEGHPTGEQIVQEIGHPTQVSRKGEVELWIYKTKSSTVYITVDVQTHRMLQARQSPNGS